MASDEDKAQAAVKAAFDAEGVKWEILEHVPVMKVEEGLEAVKSLNCSFAKNLFVKDKKGRYFLLTVGEEAEVDLKTVHQTIGASGRVSFGKPDALLDLLGVQPGAVTAFGVVNDVEGHVTLVLDATLMQSELVNCHPLTNEATTTIASSDLIRFAEATGHKPLVLNVAAASPH